MTHAPRATSLSLPGLPEGSAAPSQRPSEGPPGPVKTRAPAMPTEPLAAPAAEGWAAPRPGARRVVALYLPDLACELSALARESAAGAAKALSLDLPVGIVLAGSPDQLKPTSLLHSVNARARRLGVKPGQTAVAARALVSHLELRRVSPSELEAALGRFAEMALGVSPLCAVLMPDTLLVDVTGCSQRAGGEEALLADLCEKIRLLGHRVRGAMAAGPCAARAVARFAMNPQSIIAPNFDLAALGPLPLRALPLDDQTVGWFLKVGLLTVSDLLRQPRGALASRLPSGSGARSSPEIDGRIAAKAAEILALLAGEDRAPYAPYVPARVLAEQLEWDEPVEGTAPLFYALRSLLGRLAARLEGRGEATPRLGLHLGLDPSIARLRGAPAAIDITIDLPLPIARAAELLRVAHARLEQLALPAPLRAVRVEAAHITASPRVQLDLSRDRVPSPDALPVLLGELAAELGEGRAGVLSLQSSHVPERRMRLLPVRSGSPADSGGRARRPRKKAGPGNAPDSVWPEHLPSPPTRLLDVPVPIEGKIAKGGFITIGKTPFTVRQVLFAERLEGIGWWTGLPTTRDYAFVWLEGDEGGAEAWVMRDRIRNRAFLHGWFA